MHTPAAPFVSASPRALLRHPMLDAIYRHVTASTTLQEMLSEAPLNSAQRDALRDAAILLNEEAIAKLENYDSLLSAPLAK